jgi:thiol-disulfide isomerase/thioredoxin
MKNKIFRLLLPILILCQCNKEFNPRNNVVTIFGKVKNINPSNKLNNLEFYASDYINKNNFNESFIIDSTGVFKFKFKLTKQQDISIAYNYLFKLIVKPGDSLYLEIDGNSKTNSSFLKGLRISGNSSEINKNLINFYLKNPLDYELLNKKSAELKAERFLKFKDSLYSLQENYIDKLLLDKTFSKPFLNWIEAEKLFAYPSSFSFFNLTKFKRNQTSTEIIDLSKYNLYDLGTVKPEHLINTQISNRLSLNILSYYMISKQAEIAKLPPNKSFNFLFLELKKENIESPFLTQLLFNEFATLYLNKQNIDMYVDNLELINDVLDNSIFKEPLTAKYEETKKNIIQPIKNKKIVVLEDDSKEILENILKTSKNKIVYIDNWASWCSPCIEEFKKNTPKLYSQFHNEVEFIYLCYKSDKEAWESIIKKYNIEGKHYFINKNQEKSLMKTLSIKGFPTYSIINKKGEIINSNSSLKPSNIETINILKELTK